MLWLLIALAAYFGLATVAVIDKYILTEPIKSPAVYAATIGLLGVFSVLLLPFAWFLPPFTQIGAALLAGVLFVLALLVFFEALKKGEASRIVPLAGALVPTFTLIFANLFTGESLSSNELLGFVLLVIGGILISKTSNKVIKKDAYALKSIKNWKLPLLVILSSLLFGLHFTLTKQVYTELYFISGLVWIGFGKVLMGAGLFAFILTPSLNPSPQGGGKNRIFPRFNLGKRWRKKHGQTVGLFVTGRILGGLSGLAQNYAIAITSVSLVTALQGFQYAFLFVLVYFLGKKVKKLKENFSRRVLTQKVSAAVILTIGVTLLVSSPHLTSPSLNPSPQGGGKYRAEFGLNFSHTFAEYLGLDWQKAYDAMLSELKPSILRLPVYWNQVQPNPGDWDLSVVEYQLAKASEKNISVILALGRKLPRWPECHVPEWAGQLPEPRQQAATIAYIEEMVKLYDNYPGIMAFQIENEPLFPFGECPEPDEEFLKREIAAVRRISDKPIIITDSGELSTWLPEAKLGDVLGTTMYRHVFHENFGQITYPLPPAFFRTKAVLAKLFSWRPGLQIINVELQGEPWGPSPLTRLSISDQLELMNAKQLKKNANFAAETEISPVMFWGVEWWWWLKEVHGNDSLWETGKEIMSPQ